MTSKTGSGDVVTDAIFKLPEPVIVDMFRRIPPVNTAWPLAERMLWLQAMEGILNMLYGPVTAIDIGVLDMTGVKPEQAQAFKTLVDIVADENTKQGSGVPTDEAVARDDGAGSGSGDANTTEAAEEAGMESERSSTPEADLVAPGFGPGNDKIVMEPKSVREAAAAHGIDPDTAAAVERLESATNNPHVKMGRPPGIPSNLEMAIEAIREKGPLTAVELREWVRAKYWEHVPPHWAATLYDYVKANKLGREQDGQKRFTVRPSGEERSVAAARRLAKEPPKAADTSTIWQKPVAPKEVLPAKPSNVPMPAVKPTLGPRPPRQPSIEFTHGERSVMFSSSRAYALVSKLRVAMGSPVGEAFLADRVYGANTATNRDEVKRLCLDANDKLAEVGLKIDYIAGVGLRMSEVQ